MGNPLGADNLARALAGYARDWSLKYLSLMGNPLGADSLARALAGYARDGSLKYLSLMGNPLGADNLARALAGYARDGGNFTSAEHDNTSVAGSPAVPLTRLSIGEMSVGNLTGDMLAQFHHHSAPGRAPVEL